MVKGGGGISGANFLIRMVARFPDWQFLNLDALTYAGNLQSLDEISTRPNYRFIKADITDADAIHGVVSEFAPEWVFHFAAETHVDRSIVGPAAFVRTNVLGTFHLLEACRQIWSQPEGHLFHHVSTDEVYGSLGPEGSFTEQSPYDPSSPYSASKAGSDHLVRAYHHTYGLDTVTTNCSNNYGPRQHREKLIPLAITRMAKGEPIPIYGDGLHVRDWLFVDDHCTALETVMMEGTS